MIRRFRVALKYGLSPCALSTSGSASSTFCRQRPAIVSYAEDSSRSLMLLGSTPSANRYRLLLLLLCGFFLYTWHSQRAAFSEQLARKDEQISAAHKELESTSEKLRIIWQHKKKLESSLNAQKLDAEKLMSRIKLKESETNGCRAKNEQCARELTVCESSKEPRTTKKTNGESGKREAELRRKMVELEEKLAENGKSSSAMEAVLKNGVEQCEKKLKQLTGGGAVEQYSQNETAHFNRNHKADEPLSFDRGAIQHHIPNKLLSGRQLAKTLEEAKVRKLEERAQMDKHPEERDVRDQEVNEQPDQEEHDYKEH